MAAKSTDPERLETVILALCSSARRTEQPSADEAHLWIKEMDTETGKIRWARRDLLEEYWRLQAKIRGFLEARSPIDPPPDIERKPQSEFFTARIIDHGELPWFEIRALASIGAGLLMRHLGDPKAINKLARLAVPFDGYRHNETAKAMATLLEDAAGGPYDPTEQDWIDLAALAGYKGEL